MGSSLGSDGSACHSVHGGTGISNRHQSHGEGQHDHFVLRDGGGPLEECRGAVGCPVRDEDAHGRRARREQLRPNPAAGPWRACGGLGREAADRDAGHPAWIRRHERRLRRLGRARDQDVRAASHRTLTSLVPRDSGGRGVTPVSATRLKTRSPASMRSTNS